MPTSTTRFAPAGFFVLRTPLLAHGSLPSRARQLEAPGALATGGDLDAALADDRARARALLRRELCDPVVREALYVASPSLDSAIERWLTDPGSPRACGVEEIVVRYLARMAGRATPFGLFAGCSTGRVGDTTRLELAPRDAYRRQTRLDVHYLASLCEALATEPAIAAELEVRPGSAVYAAAGELRCVESRSDPATRTLTHHLVSLERSQALDATLERAATGARRDELARRLVAADPEIAPEEADGYVQSLCEAHVLSSDLAPLVTGAPPPGDLPATLRTSVAGRAVADTLDRLAADLERLDAGGLGAAPSRYAALADALSALPARPELARLFQVDLHKPARAELGAPVLREIARGVALLARVAPPREDLLSGFRARFAARYGGAQVPLVVALDDEAGIGLPSGDALATDPAPLLVGLDLPPDPAASRVAFGAREEHLCRRVVEAARDERLEWKLDAGDLEQLDALEPARLPEAFAVVATVLARSPAAVEQGELRVLLDSIGGPSGALLLGRFCHGDQALRAEVEAYLAAEEALRPEALFAEVVHLPAGRAGNVLCRPVLRRWEIPYLGRSGAALDRQIPVTDLLLSLEDGRLVLRSARLGREIVPRLTSAHDWSDAALPIYRLLCALQREGTSYPARWSWGPLGSAPFLPRVVEGRLVLSPARWNVPGERFARLGERSVAERYRAVQRLRGELRLPRRIGVADGDHVLPVDLDDVVQVESFLQLVRGRGRVALQELLHEELLAVGPEGAFVHELVVPFLGPSRPQPRPPLLPEPGRSVELAPARVPSARRSFAPGSEWLYVKLYCGPAAADRLLRQLVAPVVRAALASGAVTGWFFLRYADPERHLRIRLRGDPARLLGETLPALSSATEALLREGLLWKLQLDTYDRETERFGGAAGIELAEAVFEADSDAVLELVRHPDTDADARWRLALRGAHALLVELGLDLQRRLELARIARARFAREHHLVPGAPSRPAAAAATAFERALGRRFRAERGGLAALLDSPPGAGHPLDAGLRILATRSERLAPALRELQARERSGRLCRSTAELAASFVHLHVNRLLRSAHRAQELVLYDFLVRLYASELARSG